MGSGSVVREQKTASFFPLLFPLVFLPTLARLSRECPCISEGTKKRRLFVHRTDDKCARARSVRKWSEQAAKRTRRIALAALGVQCSRATKAKA